MTVNFEQGSYFVGEEDGFVRVCALQSGLTQRNVNVTINTVAMSASGEKDLPKASNIVTV